MRILTTLGGGVTHAAFAVTKASLVAAIGVTLVFGAAVVTGNGPAGAGLARAGTTSPSWIALAQVDGLAATTVQPKLGDYLSFNTGYPNTVKNPRIEVLCYQNGALVFGMAGSTTYSFQLGGGGSIWLTNGGSASCTANLYYFGFHAGQQTYNKLASTSFSAGG